MALTALIGNIEPIVPRGNFKAFEERVKQLFTVNSIPELRKVPLFITICGPERRDFGIVVVTTKTKSVMI